MSDIDTITITIKALPNGSASILAALPKPRPGMRIENAAHSLALDALGWLGKQPATAQITYSAPEALNNWLARVRQYLNEESSERFLTTVEICSACPIPTETALVHTMEALATSLAGQGWMRGKQMRSSKLVWGYTRPIDADLLACEALVRDLLDPEGLGHCASPEIRNAARRALGVKGREGLAA